MDSVQFLEIFKHFNAYIFIFKATRFTILVSPKSIILFVDSELLAKSLLVKEQNSV